MTVYAIAAPDMRRVKIGYTAKSVESRLSDLKTGAPCDLEIMSEWKRGDMGNEREIHRSFATDRICGEWFVLTPQLVQVLTLPPFEVRSPRYSQWMPRQDPVGPDTLDGWLEWASSAPQGTSVDVANLVPLLRAAVGFQETERSELPMASPLVEVGASGGGGPSTALPKMLQVGEFRVRLFDRDGDGGASIYYGYVSPVGKKVVKSTKTTDVAEAEAHVRNVFAVALCGADGPAA